MKVPKPLEILKGGIVPLLVAFVGFAGGVIGSLVGPYLTAQHQTAKDITDRRVAVYQKFFAAQAKLLQSTAPNSTKEEKDKLTKDYQQETKEARFEIGVFASAEVIQALVNWFEKKDRTDQKDLWKEDAKIYQAMRKEIFGTRGKVDDADLYNLLFKY
jgi:membrane-associated HD superfamily phosphohydrolase